MMIFMLAAMGRDPVRAAIDVIRVDAKVSALSRASGLNVAEERQWHCSSGGIDGGWDDVRWTFTRRNMLLIGFNRTVAAPYAGGDLGDNLLSNKIGQIAKAIFPEERGWRVRLQEKREASEWSPSSFVQNMMPTEEASSPVQKMLIRLERATGRPLLVMVAYKDRKLVDNAFSTDQVLALSIKGKKFSIP